MNWEYTTDYIKATVTSSEDMAASYKRYGEDGWEAYSVIFYTKDSTFSPGWQVFYKRPLPNFPDAITKESIAEV